MLETVSELYRAVRETDEPPSFSTLLADAEPVTAGRTNRVWRTAEDTIVKHVSPAPLTALFAGLAYLVAGRPTLPHQSDRVRNEQEMPTAVQRAGWETPDLLRQEDAFFEWEMVAAEPFPEWAENVSETAMYRESYRFGSNLRRLHNEDMALTDLHISNLLMGEPQQPLAKPGFLPQDRAQYWIDFEYARPVATDRDILNDLTTLVSSARHLDPDTYTAFVDGFEHGYGADIPSVAHARANITAPIHARYLEPRTDWAEHAVQNRYNGADAPHVYRYLETCLDRFDAAVLV